MKKDRKKICKMCNQRKALFFQGGRAKWDRFHDLCPRCWRSLRDRKMAESLGV